MILPNANRVMIACLCLGVVGGGNAFAGDVPGWSHVLVDDNVPNTNQHGVVGIADFGPSRFTVAYIKNQCLHFKVYTLGEGPPPSGPGFETGICSVGWLAPNTSQYIADSQTGCLAPGKGALFTNFWALSRGLDGTNEVLLMSQQSCSGFWRAPTFVSIGNGDQPVVATTGSAFSGKALVVYRTLTALMGRFFHFGAGGGLSEPFEIRTPSPGFTHRFPTVIYNNHSNRFIVGFQELGPQFACGNYTASVSSEGVVEYPNGSNADGSLVPVSGCDAGAGRHYQTAAYNPRSDGTYPWWRDGERGKGFNLMEPTGKPVMGKPQIPTFTANTGFSTHSYDTATTGRVAYFLLSSGTGTNGNLQLAGVQADGSFSPGISDENFGDGLSPRPMGVRALASETVGAYVTGTNLHITVSDLGGSAFQIPWQHGTPLALGDLVSFNNLPFRVLHAHIAQVGFEPPNAFSRFARVDTGWTWTPQAVYNPGDEVVFGGHRYDVRESHQPQSSWDPVTVPAFYQRVDNVCSTFTVTKNVYDKPQWWGTITFKNNGPNTLTAYKVEFDVPAGSHCTAESGAVPLGATLTPLTGNNPAHTTSNHCVFTWTNAPSLAPGASKTFNYSTDSQSFSSVSNIKITDTLCTGSGGSGGSCAALPVTTNRYDPPVWWGTVRFTNNRPFPITNYKVEFNVPAGKHCTAEPDAIPAGATLSPLNASGTQTISNRCVFTWLNAPLVAPNASVSFNYSTDSNASSFTSASSIAAADMCQQ